MGVVYFFCSFFGLFFHRTGFFYPFILLPLAATILLYKKPGPLALALAGVLANFAVQITGGTASPLFFVYFITIGLVGLWFGPLTFSIAALFVLAAETGSWAFHARLSAIGPVAALAVFAPIVGYFTHREKKTRLDLEKRLAVFLARQDLVAQPLDISARTRALTDPAPAVDIEPSFRYVIQVVRELFNPNSVAIFLADRKKFILSQGWSAEPSFLPQAQIDAGTGFVGWVAKEHKPLLISDFVQDARTLGYYSEPALIRSFLAVPILRTDSGRTERGLGENLLGVVAIDSKEMNGLGSKARDALQSLCRVLAHFIDTVRCYETVHREALRFSALSELSSTLLKEVKTDNVITSALSVVDTLFKPDQMGFARTDPDTLTGSVPAYTGPGAPRTGFTFGYDDGLVGWIARHNTYLINHNLGDQTAYRLGPGEPRSPGRSFLGVPVLKEDRTIGVLWLEKNDRPAFVEQDASILKLVGSLLSIALIRANLYEQIQDLAIRDSLTGLYNHRKFQELLDIELDRTRELVLLLLDLDHFKEINDRFGHPFGDAVLVKVSSVLASLRDSIAARYGGEEFAIILPHCSPERGVERAKTISQAIKNLSFQPGGTEVNVTTSIGVAFYPADGRQKWQLISVADQALYQAKEQGRDRVVASRQKNP